VKNNSEPRTPNSEFKKLSIRFFDDKEVRAVWDDEKSKWWFSVVDIVGVLTDSKDPRKYWSVLKTNKFRVDYKM
jgi:cell filamentation protein